MKQIGGFFELELSATNRQPYHRNAVSLWCGRACLNLIIQQLKPKRVYAPFYACDALFEPLIENRIEYEFYGLDDLLEIKNFPSVGENEILIYVNYFGLKEDYLSKLLEIYGAKLIIDNTQAFFSSPPDAIWFNSARKFFGVADGAFVSTPFPVKSDFAENETSLYGHLIDKLAGKQNRAYAKYLANEAKFDSSLKQMSVLSQKILRSIDYDLVHARRRENFAVYEQSLDEFNLLKCKLDKRAAPFCYPLRLDNLFDKCSLFKQNIFIPTLWNEVLERKVGDFEFEKKFASTLLPLPCDQRYNAADCRKVIKTVLKIYYER